jgi:colanic acid biosynthesis glycosyl transferase WcaI
MTVATEKKSESGPAIANRVWVVSELYYPEDTSTGYFLTKIAEGLACHFPLNVLCGRPTYAARGIRTSSREQRHGVNIRRCRGTTLNKDVLLFRMLNLLTVGFSIFSQALFSIRRTDLVLVVTNPPLLPYLLALACRLKRARLLLLIHDVYPEVLVATGLVRPGSVLTRMMGTITRCLYRHVQRIIVLGRDMESLIHYKLGNARTPTVIIPNWADGELVLPASRRENEMLRDLGLTDKFVVQYSGNLGRTHGLEDLLAAAKKIQVVPDVHFLFIGTGAKKKWLEDRTKELQLTNVTLLPPRPRENLSTSLNACDVAIVSFITGMAGVSVPSRMYNIMAAGKPIIAVVEEMAELSLVVDEERIGWVVAPGHVDQIVKSILTARSNQALLAEMGQRARNASVSKYSFNQVLSAYVGLLADLNNETAKS